MNVDNLREGIKLVNAGVEKLRSGSIDYYVSNLIECYEHLLSLAPFKIGDRVKLAKTPVINEHESWGWIGAKHFLVKGATATVRIVEARHKEYLYLLEFDDDSWISHDKKVNQRPATDRGTYCFRQDYIETIGMNNEQ